MRLHDAQRSFANAALCAAAAAVFMGSPAPAVAADISGVWANQRDVCTKIYVKKQGKLQFSPTADLDGSGFIVEGSTIRGKTTTCRIRSMKEDGDVLHVAAVCANDIMISDTNFELKIDGKDKLTRFYPGVPEIATQYVRCPKL